VLRIKSLTLTLLSGSACSSSPSLGSIVTSSLVPSAFLMDILQPDLVRAMVFERPNLIEGVLDFSSDIVAVVNSLDLACKEKDMMCEGDN
jgi:hypothetical protein